MPIIKTQHHQILIPMCDESNSDKFAHANSAQWVYCLDCKKHGKIPPIVMPRLMDIFGGEEKIRSAGYRKHWLVFEDPRTNLHTFGNYYSFSTSSDPNDREIAASMMVVDIEELKTL
jgi:hypothetical protein